MSWVATREPHQEIASTDGWQATGALLIAWFATQYCPAATVPLAIRLRSSDVCTTVCTAACTAAGRIEKYILRKAFDTPDRPYLPEHVLYRQKEQFSDGVGYNWIDGLKAHADSVVSDQQLAASEHRCGRRGGWWHCMVLGSMAAGSAAGFGVQTRSCCDGVDMTWKPRGNHRVVTHSVPLN
jgi:hypothetical protein